jgi:hypothetical protein
MPSMGTAWADAERSAWLMAKKSEEAPACLSLLPHLLSVALKGGGCSETKLSCILGV